MLNIVVIEDNPPLRESLVEVLAATGHHVVAFDSAESFASNCSVTGVDIMVLDLNLPGEDGISLAGRMRRLSADMGIIMLTAHGTPEQRQTGYDNGADIYLEKPSSAEELTSAIRSLARRMFRRSAPDESNRDHDQGPILKLNCQAMSLTGGAQAVALSAVEAAMLKALILAPENRLSTEDLSRLTSDEPVSKATLGVKIVRLRHKLVLVGAPEQPIRAVRNWGYQLAVAVTLS